MARKAIRRTDFGTVLLHWLLIASLLVVVLTGLKLTAYMPGYDWLHALPFIIPAKMTWSMHMFCGAVAFCTMVAYVVYMSRSGLAKRIWPDRSRLLGIFGRRSAVLGAINVILYWLLFGLMAALMVTGLLMYIGRGGMLVEVHRMATWGILAFPLAHVAVHFLIGGAPQLMRVFRPAPLAPPPPRFDPFEILALPPAEVRSQIIGAQGTGAHPQPALQHAAADRGQRGAGGSRLTSTAQQWRRSETMLQANPLMVALGAGIGAFMLLLSADDITRDTLVVKRINPKDAPALDGDIADLVWRRATPVTIDTQQGFNFDGKGATTIQVRAVHDGETAYFSYVWDDPTRSLKHLPLQKREDGWYVLQTNFAVEDENVFAADALSMALTTTDRPNIRYSGGHTFFLGEKPIAGQPASLSGRGLHATNGAKINDVFYWKAAQGGMLGWCDDAEIGMAKQATPEQAAGRTRYYGGLAYDPGRGMSELNFQQRPPAEGYGSPIRPKRLPRNPAKMKAAMGQVSRDPERSDSDGSVWWLSETESAPYSEALDAQFPVGSVIPGILIAGDPVGDRADIRCAARWAAGRWTLEAARLLDTGSEHDVVISDLMAFRVAAFDHSQIGHTRQIRVIKVDLE
jgi:cytochrome b subunit of formate dehydrogenase